MKLKQEPTIVGSSVHVASKVGSKHGLKEALEVSPLLPQFGGLLTEDAQSYITKLDFYYKKLGVSDQVFLDVISTTINEDASLWFVQGDYKTYQ